VLGALGEEFQVKTLDEGLTSSKSRFLEVLKRTLRDKDFKFLKERAFNSDNARRKEIDP
jgi:hypothetical protein